MFAERLKSRELRTNALPKASPNLNGRCERFIETIKLDEVEVKSYVGGLVKSFERKAA